MEATHTMPLTTQAFKQAAKSENIDDAVELVKQLDDLAQWVICDGVLERVARRANWSHLTSSPTITEANKQPGACLLVLVCSAGEHSILREGYLLPVHWKHGGTHDPRLPGMVRQVADEALQALGSNSYSLHMMLPGQTGPTQPFLPDVTDEMKSAFASLACGLQMLEKGCRPDFRTIATGRYATGRIVPVSHIREKTLGVMEFPPRQSEKRFTTWFVPAGEGCDIAARTIEEHDLTASQPTQLMLRQFPEFSDLQKQLNSLLACSGVRPDAASDFGVLQDYYQWLQALDFNEGNKYYNEVLYKQIVDRGFVGGLPDEVRPTHFVSVVSTPALIGLAHRLFRFENVLILHTVPEIVIPGQQQRIDFSEKAKQAKDLIEIGFQKNVSIQPFKYRAGLAGMNLWDSLASNLRQHVEPFIKNVQPGRVMWDMTSGLRVFSHVLEKKFARRSDWMLTINQQWSAQQGNRIPCTETLLVWQHGDPSIFG